MKICLLNWVRWDYDLRYAKIPSYIMSKTTGNPPNYRSRKFKLKNRSIWIGVGDGWNLSKDEPFLSYFFRLRERSAHRFLKEVWNDIKNKPIKLINPKTELPLCCQKMLSRRTHLHLCLYRDQPLRFTKCVIVLQIYHLTPIPGVSALLRCLARCDHNALSYIA